MNAQPYIVPVCTEAVRFLHEDEALLFVSKPAFLLSIPGHHAANKDCLITRVQQTHPTARIAHRLDLDTSGIMVLALTAPARSHLGRQFEKRVVDKTYQAVVFGQVEQDQGTINLPIAPDWPNRPKQKIDFSEGRESITHFQVLERQSDRTRLLLTPETGRSHQLRIHLASIGHPILGCDLYAHPEARALSARLLLHAESLELFHPLDNHRLRVEDPCPF